MIGTGVHPDRDFGGITQDFFGMLLHVINMTKGSDFIILSCDPTYVLVDIALYVIVIPLRCTTAWNSGGLLRVRASRISGAVGKTSVAY